MSTILTNTGDQAIIPLTFPLENVKSILSYDESLTGENSPSNLTREFRYTTDLLKWFDWATLTNLALQNLVLDYRQDFNIEFRYTKTDSVGQVVIDWVVPVTDLQVVVDNLDDSLFSILDSSDRGFAKLWEQNVLQKVYEKGIVPDYIERDGDTTDRDYVDFWRSIVNFLSIVVAFSRRFESLEQIDLVRKILDSRGLFYKRNSDLASLVSLVLSTSTIFSQRGSAYDELERLFGRRAVSGEIFIFSDSVPGTTGIFLDRNSIFERYLHDQFEVELISLLKTPDSFIGCSILDNIVTVTAVSTIIAQKIEVDARIDYEVMMLVKGTGSFTVDVKMFDTNDLEYGLTYLDPSVVLGPPLLDVTPPVFDQWYLVRLVIYGTNTIDTISQPSILVGSNIKMTSEISKLDVNVTFTGNLEIKDYFVKILHTQYSKSFLQSSQLVDTWYTDKSGKSSPIELAHHSLINYSKTMLVNTGTRDNSESIAVTYSFPCGSLFKSSLVIGGYTFLLHKKVGNYLENELEVGDTIVGSIPGFFFRATYLGGDETDFTNSLVYNNWGGSIIE